MSDLRKKVIRLAASMPKDSAERKALLEVLASNKEGGKDPADVIVQMLSNGGSLFKDLEKRSERIVKAFDKGQKQLEGSKRYTANGDFQVALVHLRQISDSLKDLSKYAADLSDAIDDQTRQLPRLASDKEAAGESSAVEIIMPGLKFSDALSDLEDDQTIDLALEAYDLLRKKTSMSSNEIKALYRLKDSMERGKRWGDDMHRNNIFKAANLLGIKLPSMAF